HQSDFQRAIDRQPRRLRAPRRARHREPCGGTADFWDQALICSDSNYRTAPHSRLALRMAAANTGLILRSGRLAASRRMDVAPVNSWPSFETREERAPQDEVRDI